MVIALCAEEQLFWMVISGRVFRDGDCVSYVWTMSCCRTVTTFSWGLLTGTMTIFCQGMVTVLSVEGWWLYIYIVCWRMMTALSVEGWWLHIYLVCWRMVTALSFEGWRLHIHIVCWGMVNALSVEECWQNDMLRDCDRMICWGTVAALIVDGYWQC